jgi:peptidoglycan/xylan/chitin deacetylase (PgdA/CDA1 family)
MLLLTPGGSDSWNVSAAGFASQDEALVTVSETGVLTAVAGEGSTFVYALDEAGSVTARILVTVLAEPLTVSLAAPAPRIQMGQTMTLEALFNHPVTPAVSWSSSDTAICTVDENGTVTGLAYGTATVTATLSNGSTAQCDVTVSPPITSLALEKSLHKIKPGATRQLNALAEPMDSGEELLWSSSDPAIVAVDETGTVTGLDYGTATITVTGKYSGLTASCTVKVCDVIQVAMTFDDGPSYQTEILLDFLKENEIHVTFFMVGNRINKHFKHIVVRSAAEGHEMGYHSYDHAEQTAVATQTIVSQFNYTDNLLYELTGQHFTVWRTPYGSYNQRVTGAVPLPHILWSLDTLDWSSLNADKVYKAIINGADDGDIILMHDLYASTVNGAIKAMKEMLAGDYEFLTVTELLSRNGKTPIDSKTYFSGR